MVAERGGRPWTIEACMMESNRALVIGSAVASSCCWVPAPALR
jgi:hypothetical protein